VRSFAFHPEHKDPNSMGFGKLYTAHSVRLTVGGSNHDSVVAEWTLTDDGLVDVDVAPREIIRITQPRGDHNIGRIGFNPNLSAGDADFGNLCIALGDGGNYRDDRGDETLNPNAQDPQQLLGKMLRIDPATPDDEAGLAYTVPTDNPFVGNTDFRPEIWAMGLRNPLTFGWDLGGNGNMYIGDIGQSDIEEVNLGAGGANYGWSEREGAFSVAGKIPDASSPIEVDELPVDHASDGFVYPVAQYDHAPNDDRNLIGNAAIAGGYVYRSDRVPPLNGKYFFGDFANNTGPIWIVDEADLDQETEFGELATQDNGYLAPFEELRLVNDDGEETTLRDLLRDSTGNSRLSRTDMRFGQGADGEVFLMNKHDGWIRRFAFAIAGDCNGDGVVDAMDLDCACTDLNPLLGALNLPLGDLDGDGEVGFPDFLRLSANFGLMNSPETPIGYSEGDLTCDGEVEFDDFLQLSQNFGQTAAEMQAAVPEPAAGRIALWLVLLFSYVSRTKHR